MVSNVDPRILGYLGRGLSLELSAVQLYSTQASLTQAWGLSEAADHLRKEAHEELGHAERIIARMLAYGAAPNASQLRPVKLGNSLIELLEHDFHFENDLVKLYDDATRYCAKTGSRDDRVFFEQLLREESQHATELAAWIKKLATPGGDVALPSSQQGGATF